MDKSRLTTPRQMLDLEISERDFRRQVLALAKLRGWKTYTTWISLHSPEGFPDLFMVRPATKSKLALELKREEGKLTEAQAVWLRDLRACGIPAYYAMPSDWEKVVKWLE